MKVKTRDLKKIWCGVGWVPSLSSDTGNSVGQSSQGFCIPIPEISDIPELELELELELEEEEEDIWYNVKILNLALSSEPPGWIQIRTL